MFRRLWRKLFPAPVVAPPATTDCFQFTPEPAGNVDHFHRLFNAYRHDLGRPPLVLDCRLQAIADQTAQKFATRERSTLLAHIHQLRDRLTQHGFPGRAAVVITTDHEPGRNLSHLLQQLFVENDEYRQHVRSLGYTRMGADYSLDADGLLCWSIVLADDTP